ncbi:MAG: type II toxin-antitoxin system prevent-host-death family antitoxin [Alphaproteobacteria bacterium]|nr:type II toxin-antitoxin system prevent-host-death family antitoxin [Alphaproteobacteria bacterium]
MKSSQRTSTVGVFEAKTHLSALLERVEKGERFVITRHGQPVAELRSPKAETPTSFEETKRWIENFRATHTLGDVSIRELVDEGRRR